jgi:hypothetical protein
MSTKFSLLSPLEIAACVSENANNVEFMIEYTKYLQSCNSSSNDAGLASSLNVPVTYETENVNDSFVVENVQLDQPLETFEQSNQPTNSDPSKPEEVAPSGKKKSGVQTKKDENPKSPLIFKREYYSLKDVADCFGIGVSSMHKLRQKGNINGFLLAGKWMFTREQIEAFENRLTSGQITV